MPWYSGPGECLPDRLEAGDCGGRAYGTPAWTPFFREDDPDFAPYGCRDGTWCCCQKAAGGKTESCDGITHPVERDWCYATLGADTGNVTLCERTLNVYWMEACVRDVAIRLGDGELCARLSRERKDHCMLEVAVNKADAALCRGISDPRLAEICSVETTAKNRRTS